MKKWVKFARWTTMALLCAGVLPYAVRAAEPGGSEVTGTSLPELNTAQELRTLRDPFKMIHSDIGENRPRSEIESVSLEEVKVVGILTGPTRTRALVRVKDKTYVVGEGMRIGTEGTVIQKITSRGMVITGSRTNVIGDQEQMTIEIPLAPENKKKVARADTYLTEAAIPAGASTLPANSGASSNGDVQIQNNPNQGLMPQAQPAALPPASPSLVTPPAPAAISPPLPPQIPAQNNPLPNAPVQPAAGK